MEADELLTSSEAAASLLEPGTRAAVVGDPGIIEALDGRGVSVVGRDENPSTIVVGRSVRLDFADLAAAATAIRDGARFIATNNDATFPTPHGLEPGAGAVVAYLEVSSGRQAEVAGKPHQAAADLLRARFGPAGLVVGDRPDTDGRFAQLIKAPFALVLSGVTRPEDLPVTPAPALVAADLAGVVSARLGRSGWRGGGAQSANFCKHRDGTVLGFGMARDDRFKKYQEAGADFLEMARTRAEEFLSELSKLGDSTQKQAQDAFEEMVEGSRRGTEQIVNTIRAEIASQLSVIGIATRREIDDLERRLTTLETSGPTATAGAVGPARKARTAKKAAPTKKAAPAGGSGAKKAAAAKTAPAKTAPAKKAATKKAPAKTAPAQKAAAKKAGGVQKAAPAKRAPVKRAPVKRAPVKKATGGA